MSSSTGPGLRARCSGPGPAMAPRATANAIRTAHGISSGLVTCHAQRVAGQAHADRVRLLERVGSELGARHLPGDRDEGGRVHEGIGEGGEEVGGPRAGGPHAHPGPSRRPRVALRRVARSLLVPHEHVADPIPRAEERVVDRHVRAARIAEHEVHAFGDEGLDQQLGAVRGPVLGPECRHRGRPRRGIVRRVRRKVRKRLAAGRFDRALVFGLDHFLTRENEKTRLRTPGAGFRSSCFPAVLRLGRPP